MSDPTLRPRALTLRSYQVGFGDCSLLSIDYGREERHVLIDFGSAALPAGAAEDQLGRIARDIAARCVGKLHVVVATHRHKDHVSGFATSDTHDAPGDLIRALQPEVVIQPWTEAPDLAVDATAPRPADDDRVLFLRALSAMQTVAARAAAEVKDRLPTAHRHTRDEIAFVAEDNLANPAAMNNLATMAGARQLFVSTGSDLREALADVLPGVTAHVLGPPTPAQSDAIRKERRRDDAEFWHLQALGAIDAPLVAAAPPPDAGASPIPPSARWLAGRLDAARMTSLLGVVRALDKAVNNTSVILLLEIGGKKLLFSGDAQLECWQVALDGPGGADHRGLLCDVDLYKVGQHGSFNSTPRTLWEGFSRRCAPDPERRLVTVLSTMAGQHGRRENGTEVPRGKLVDALQADSRMFTTQNLGRDEIYIDIHLAL